MSYPRLLEKLIEQFIKLPGVGRRSAERMAFWILNNPVEEAREFSSRILALKENLRFCRTCNNFTEQELCHICTNPGRDKSKICVVEDPKDLLAIERTGTFNGHYHVLLGAMSPTEGRGPEDLKIQNLVQKVKANDIKEVVIATDPDTEGEMTALYITNELKPTGVKVTRIGLGIPVGSSVEFADLSTLTMSMSSRREI